MRPATTRSRRPLGRISALDPRPGMPSRAPAGVSQMEKAGLSTGPLCSFPIVGGAPSQGVRNLVGLPFRFAFAARRTGQPLVSADHCLPSKVDCDHLSQVLVSNPFGPVRPALVSHP